MLEARSLRTDTGDVGLVGIASGSDGALPAAEGMVDKDEDP